MTLDEHRNLTGSVFANMTNQLNKIFRKYNENINS